MRIEKVERSGSDAGPCASQGADIKISPMIFVGQAGSLEVKGVYFQSFVDEITKKMLPLSSDVRLVCKDLGI